MEGVRGAWRQAQDGKEYIDVHNWHFTPESFRLVVEDLRDLGLLELGIVDGPTGAGGEFCVCLQRRAGARHHRMASLVAIANAPR